MLFIVIAIRINALRKMHNSFIAHYDAISLRFLFKQTASQTLLILIHLSMIKNLYKNAMFDRNNHATDYYAHKGIILLKVGKICQIFFHRKCRSFFFFEFEL